MTATAGTALRDHIFISYRRDDARGASGRLYDWLRIGFGRDRVFRDVHSIGAGKWRDKIDTALARSAVCVAVIGPRWANADNLPRLKDAGDMVRHELVTALSSGDLTLVPTLVEGAKVPPAVDLPPELRPLFDVWNAREVTESGWEDDTRRLIAEIAEAARLPVGPDLDTLLRNAGAASERLAQLESERHLQADQIERLRGTVADLTRKLAEAGAGRERAELSAAFAALSRGDTEAAEDAFEREFEARARAEEDERLAKAEAARNVANLALLRDVAKAIAFYRKALDAQPDHAETVGMLGEALVTAGDLPAAGEAFTQSLTLAREQSNRWCEVGAQLGLGGVAMSLGEWDKAMTAYTAALDLSEELARNDPGNAASQRGLLMSHGRIGDVLVAQKDGPGALAAYRKGLSIAKAMAARDPGDTEPQENLAVSYERIGDVLDAQGDALGAIAAHREGLKIADALATRDPANTRLQLHLLVSHLKVGDRLLARDDRPGALTAYRDGLAIAQALVRDPGNSQWQRDLSVSHHRIGDVLVAQGDGPGALAAYRKSNEIFEALAARDPANAQWQTDVALSCAKLGTLEHGQDVDARRGYLLRGRDILVKLKEAGRLMPNQDRVGWFDEQIEALPPGQG